jgi:hypothetical protein
MRQVQSIGLPTGSVFTRAFRPSRGVTVVPTGGSGVILRSPGGECASLNGMAGRVWTLLERGASLRTIHRLIQQEYGAPWRWLEQELPSVLETLVRGGFLERTA